MRIGTRASALALAQARWVVDRLGEDGTEVEIVRISTLGDRGEQPSDKARWVSELERALEAGTIDVAVHSAKDVPAELAPGTELAAFPGREDPRDALCGARSLAELPSGARVGTSSLRRTAQLRALRADLNVTPMRGNVDTRLRRLADREVDALVLAMAGLRRLGRHTEAGGALDAMIPAAGQGALALQARIGSPHSEALARLGDPVATACVTAERELTRALGASCNTAVGAFAQTEDGEEIDLQGWVGLPDGSEWISDRLTRPRATVGAEMASRLLAAGAAELLRRAETETV